MRKAYIQIGYLPDVEIEYSVTKEDVGIGHYEFQGQRCFDSCFIVVIDEMKVTDNNLTTAERIMCKKYIENNDEIIEEKIINGRSIYDFEEFEQM